MASTLRVFNGIITKGADKPKGAISEWNPGRAKPSAGLRGGDTFQPERIDTSASKAWYKLHPKWSNNIVSKSWAKHIRDTNITHHTSKGYESPLIKWEVGMLKHDSKDDPLRYYT